MVVASEQLAGQFTDPGLGGLHLKYAYRDLLMYHKGRYVFAFVTHMRTN